MEVLGMAFRQAPKPCCSSSRSDLVGLCRLDPVEDMRTGLLRWGSGPDVDPFPWPCVVRRRSPLAARNWKGTALSPCAQSSNENRKLCGLKNVCCCMSYELQDTCCLVVVNFSWKNSDLNKFNMVFGSFFPGIRVGQHICVLKLSFRGVKSFNSECMLCILEARQANEQAGDGEPRSFGLIRRWHVRKPLLLIPGYDGRERFILGSVKRSQDLQFLTSCAFARSITGRVAGSMAGSHFRGLLKTPVVALCQSSQLTRHQTPAIVFPVLGLMFSLFL